jgi:hypothetical protein
MGRKRKSWTAGERAAITKAVDELIAIEMDRERALAQARAEVRKGASMIDVFVVDDDGSIRPHQSTKSILDWSPKSEASEAQHEPSHRSFVSIRSSSPLK